MSRLNKLVCLICCLAIALGCLASCDIIDGLGNAEINPNKYEASVRIVFATDDDKMKDAVDSLSSSSVILSDGENVSVLTTAGSDDARVTDSYRLFDGTLYHSLEIVYGDYSAESLEKAELNEIDKALLLNNVGPSADVDVTDFNTVEENGADGIYTYTCTDITDEARASLLEILASDFDSIGAEVRLTDVTYVLDTKNDIEIGSTLSCSLEITVDGATYLVTMRTYTEYDYSARVNITAPENADDYTSVSYEEIIK